MLNFLKAHFTQSPKETTPIPADEESLSFLEKITYLLRGSTYRDTPLQNEIENLVHGVYRNFEERELRILLAKYHSSFRDIHTVLSDKPYHNCEVNSETRDDIILFIQIFGETAKNYFYENGTKFPVLYQSVDDIIALQKFDSNDKIKKRA